MTFSECHCVQRGIYLMNCENIFCIYWEKDKCILDNINLDISGVCQSCIYIELNDKVLETYRKNGIDKINGYYEK